MENISRGPTFGDFVTIRSEVSMQDVTVARLQTKRVQTSLSPLFYMWWGTAWESLSVDSQNIPCATLKRRGSWAISVYLWVTTILLFFFSRGQAKNAIKKLPVLRILDVYPGSGFFYPGSLLGFLYVCCVAGYGWGAPGAPRLRVQW
jgi:hypothetical protein